MAIKAIETEKKLTPDDGARGNITIISFARDGENGCVMFAGAGPIFLDRVTVENGVKTRYYIMPPWNGVDIEWSVEFQPEI